MTIIICRILPALLLLAAGEESQSVFNGAEATSLARIHMQIFIEIINYRHDVRALCPSCRLQLHSATVGGRGVGGVLDAEPPLPIYSVAESITSPVSTMHVSHVGRHRLCHLDQAS